MKGLFSTALVLAEKDVRIEVRSKETTFAVLLFVLLVLLIFNLSFGEKPAVVRETASGIIWSVIVFAGTIAISHLSHREFEDRAKEGLLLTGCGAAALFWAKFVTTLLFLLVIELVTVPVFLIFFNFGLGPWVWPFLSIVALGSIGYAAVGTLFGELLSHARLRNLLLPVVIYPVLVPLLIAAIRGTSACFAGDAPREIALLLGYDVVFLVASVLLFDFAVEDPT